MELLTPQASCNCETNETTPESSPGLTSMVPFILSSPDDLNEGEACCGAPAGPPASPYEKAGYAICPFVDGFIPAPTGLIPRVKTRLSLADRLGTLRVRMNISRNDYTVAPGLYALGNPDPHAPILVTANFKLTFDQIRQELQGIDAYLLVLDTRGINVWCAAGKGTFGTDELVNRVRQAGLADLVAHSKLIVPQLGATGVSARQVKKQTGFSVIWGPVHCRDLRRFIESGCESDETMRQVTFDFWERIVLIPVEVAIAAKPFALLCLAAVILSGIGPHLFSFSDAFQRGWAAVIILVGGLFAGAALTPALLDRLPGTMFSIKGVVAGLSVSAPLSLIFGRFTGLSGMAALTLAATAISSYLAMNFTGTTPFTSPSGVEKEMKTFIPVQAAMMVLSIILWLISAY